MKPEAKITLVKGVHTVIYVLNVAGTFYILYCGWTKTYNIWLAVALALLTIESVAFVSNKLKCPMADLAEKYGAPSGHLGDPYLPGWLSRAIFRLIAAAFILGVVLLLLNVANLR